MSIKLKQIQGGLELQTNVNEVVNTVGDETKGLVKKVNDINADVEVLNGPESQEGSVAHSVKAAKDELQVAIDGKSDVGHGHEAAEIVESDEKQFVSAERKGFYDENTAYTNDMATVNGLGGIAAGTTFDNMPVNEVLTKLLYPYVAPSVSASSSPNGGVFEFGNNQNVTNIRASVTKKSEKITKVEALNGGEVLGTKEGAEVANGGNIDFPVTQAVSGNKNFAVRVTDAANKVYNANTGSFTFVYPYFMGKCANDATINEDLVKGLTKKIETKGNKSQAFTCNFERMVFAYPKSYGAIKQILDPNNFDVTGTFGRQEVSIVGLDGTTQVYYVYVNSASTVSNFNVRFNY